MVRNQLKSFKYAFAGLFILLRSQPNARFHFFATLLCVAAGTLLRITTTEWALISLSIGLVWAAEALNTAVEFLADRVSPEWNELVGKAKDVAAGGVLAASIAAAAAGLFVFLPHV